jgi:hypothetical protein
VRDIEGRVHANGSYEYLTGSTTLRLAVNDVVKFLQCSMSTGRASLTLARAKYYKESFLALQRTLRVCFPSFPQKTSTLLTRHVSSYDNCDRRHQRLYGLPIWRTQLHDSRQVDIDREAVFGCAPGLDSSTTAF